MTLSHIQLTQSRFEKAFSHLKNKNIAIYGIGRATGNIVPILKEFRIVGLIDRNPDNIGKYAFGIKILSMYEAGKSADCIIINTSETYWRSIYERIKSCGLPIYLKNGNLAENYFKPFSLVDLFELCKNENEKSVIYIMERYLSRCEKWDGVFSTWEDWGFCVWGMVVWSYLYWMENQRKKDGCHQILFLSRDGYLLKKAYDEFLGKTDCSSLIDSRYVVTSRRLTYAANVHDDRSFQEYSKDFFNGTFADYLMVRYGVSVQEKDSCSYEILRLPADSAKLEKLIQGYNSLLREELWRERERYLEYLSGLSIKENCGIVDTGYTGRIAECLKNLLHVENVRAYFFYGDLRPSNLYRSNIKSCFQKDEDMDASSCALRQYSFLVETVFRAPVGTAINILEDGFVYDKAPNFLPNQKIYDGIFRFMQEAREDQWDIKNWKEISLFVDKAFSYMISHTQLQDDLQEKLQWDDAWSGKQYE